MSYREDLKAYLDGELSEARAREVEQAIARDSSLSEEAAQLRSLSAAFQAIPAPAPHGMERTLEALTHAQGTRLRPTWGRPLALALAGAFALIIATVIFFPVFGPSVSKSKESIFASGADTASVATASAPAPVESSVEERQDQRLSKAAQKAPTVIPPVTLKSEPAQVTKRSAPAAAKADVVAANANKNKASTSDRREAPPEPPAEKKDSPKPTTAAGVAPELDAQPMEIKVPSVELGRDALLAVVQEFGGSIVEPSEKSDASKATVELEVPADQEQKLIARLKELPRELKENPQRFDRKPRDQAPVADFAASKRAAPKAEATNRKHIRIVLLTQP
jgi:anti-sigma factor RsiW